MSVSIRGSELWSAEVLDAHRIVMTAEIAAAGSLEDRMISVRPADRDRGEFGDVVIEIKWPMVPAVNAEGELRDWCWVCHEWYPAGTHKANEATS